VQNGVIGIGANRRTPPRAATRVVERLPEAGGMFYSIGSGALMLAHVAAGRLAGYWEAQRNARDCLAGVVSRVVVSLDGSAAARPRGLKRWRAGGGAVAIAGSSAGSGWRRQPEPEIHDDRRDDDPARPGREGPRC
jgi:myo-inositol-1(or 4)-monophosphatase